jgi:hypothetical protein
LDEGEGGLAPTGIEPFAHGASQPGNLFGQLIGAAGGLPQPERDGGVLARGVAHPHDAVRDLDHLPWVGAQKEHVTLEGLDGKVLVHRADEHVSRLHQYAVVTGLGNRPA